MRAHIFQHVPFEELGSIQNWLDGQNADITWTRFHEVPMLPTVKEIDLLIALGGPMSVNDEAELPWLVSEKAFVREAVQAGKPVLGICLGAQLIANALGGRVYPGPQKEIGWFPIQAVNQTDSAFRFPLECTVFHWHGETFDLPAGAIRLAESSVVPNQAFQVGRRAIGLQFHLETTADSLAQIAHHCVDELQGGPTIQTAEQMMSNGPRHYPEIHALMRRVLDYITA